QKYDGTFEQYKFHLNIQHNKKLSISTEHRLNKKLYRSEFDESQIPLLTQQICDTCEQLLELLQDLIDNGGQMIEGKNEKTLQITEHNDKLEINIK
ncbi:unnamed protein product, partial [Didymodactylos carnosus]